MRKTKKKVLNILIILMVLTLTLSSSWGSTTVYAEDDDLLYLIGNADYDKAYDILDRINAERSKRGLASLSMDQELMDAAMTRAAETVFYFEHARLNGGAWNSVNARVNGENLGKGTGSTSHIMSLWMKSPTHRENVLRGIYRSVGVACFECRGSTYWVQLYGVSGSEGAEKPENGTISVGIDLPEGGGFTPELEIIDAYSYEPLADAAVEAESEDGEGETGAAYRLFEGDRLRLGLGGDGLTFDPSKLSWTVSDPELATVDENGVLRITGRGELTVTAATGNTKRASVKIATKRHIKDTYIIDAFSKTEDITKREYLEEPVCPKLILFDEDGILREGIDYLVNYKNNEAAGNGEIEIRGIGKYGGIASETFEIN